MDSATVCGAKEHVEADSLIGLNQAFDRLAARSPLPVRDVRQVGDGRFGLCRQPALFFRCQLDPKLMKLCAHGQETSEC